ncbi:MAG: hypothetical protein PF487_08320 [Bacteroidales bacterium]|jgi:hypothetical protein|nr:hypothetical protein [Bacteroidales bacterium]
MLAEKETFGCYPEEIEFLKYFNRLRETGMSFHEIECKLPQLEKYYQEMVINEMDNFDIPTLKNLFDNW